MAKQPSYSSIVSRAERAVQGVKDPELRKLAYAKVLDEMLGPAPSATRAEPKEPARKAPARATPAKTRRGPSGRIRELVDEGFFKKPKTIAQVRSALEERGHHIPLTSMSGPLQKFCQAKVLRRQKKKSGNKETYSYSNW